MKISTILSFLIISTIVLGQTIDNKELSQLYQQDQADRNVDSVDWNFVTPRDQQRESRVYQLLDSNQVHTSTDYYHSAMIFQHGSDTTAYRMAMNLMKMSIELDSNRSKWLYAAATDRYLMSKKEPQIYGTQYQIKGNPSRWVLWEIDTSKVTDSIRIEFNVRTLQQQGDFIKEMNSK